MSATVRPQVLGGDSTSVLSVFCLLKYAKRVGDQRTKLSQEAMTLVEEIQALEANSIEELYKLLGEQLLSGTLGVEEFSDDEKKEEAINWESRYSLSLCQSICGSHTYKIYAENPEQWNWVMISAALADLITGVVIGVSPLTVAALILKKGLDKLCVEEDNSSNAVSMTSTPNQQHIIRTERGLTIAGTRITLYDVMDYVVEHYPSKFIRAMLDLTDEQVSAALSYIEAHQTEVEAEYQLVLKEAEELRQYYEEQNRERMARIAAKPPKPGTEAIRAKLQARRAKLESRA